MKKLILALVLLASPAWGQTMEYMQWQMQNDDRADAETNAFIAQERQQIAMQELADELRQQRLDAEFQRTVAEYDKEQDPRTWFPE